MKSSFIRRALPAALLLSSPAFAGDSSLRLEIAEELIRSFTRGPVAGCDGKLCLSVDRKTVATAKVLARSNTLSLCAATSPLSGCQTLPPAVPYCDNDSCACTWSGCIDGSFAAECASHGFGEVRCASTEDDGGNWTGWSCVCTQGGNGSGGGEPIS